MKIVMHYVYSRTLLILLFALCVMSFQGCKNNKIQVYTAPKDAQNESLISKTLSEQLPGKSPSHWVQKPLTGIRQANYQINDEIKGAAELSVISFAGDVGGLLANVNRWRGQLKLAPISENQLPSQIQSLSLNKKDVTLVTIYPNHVSQSSEGRSQEKGMIVGIFMHKNQTYFVKLMGDYPLVKQERDAVKAYIGSLDLE